MKKQQLAGILVCVLGFGATVTEAQYGYNSPQGAGTNFSAGISPSFFENGRRADLGRPVSSVAENDGGLAVDNARATNAPFLTNDTLALPRPHTSMISYVGAGAGDDNVVFDTSGFGGGEGTMFTRPGFNGLRFDLSPRVSLGLGYKNFTAEDPYYNSPPLWNFPAVFEGVRTYSVLFTLRLKF